MSRPSQRTGILKLFPEAPRTGLRSDKGRLKRGRQAPGATPPLSFHLSSIKKTNGRHVNKGLRLTGLDIIGRNLR